MNRFLETLIVTPPSIGRDRQFIAWIGGPVTALAFVVTSSVAGSAPLWLVSAAVCLATLMRALRPLPAPTRISLLADGRWHLSVAGTEIESRLERSWGARWGPVIGLQWQEVVSGRRRALWLLRADCEPATWRRLRVRLLIA